MKPLYVLLMKNKIILNHMQIAEKVKRIYIILWLLLLKNQKPKKKERERLNTFA
jgi:hypothetical protein